MPARIIFFTICILGLSHLRLSAQTSDTLINFSAIVYDDSFMPVPATHVINMNSHKGDVTDSLGIFRLPVRPADTLLIRNIAFHDTLVAVTDLQQNRSVRMKRRLYELEEAKIFIWGSSYDDFQEAFLQMPMQQTLRSSLGLPTQDPEKVPVEMDEKAVKSAGLLLTSPISFFYYNFSKHAKSARKVYWLQKNQEKSDQFEAIVSSESLSEITGLTGAQLQEFQIFLSQRMVCDFNCSELAIYQEIHGLLKVYHELEERGMLNESVRTKKEGT